MFFGNINNHGKTQDVQEQDCFSAVFDKTQNPDKEFQDNKSMKTEDKENIQDHANIRETKASRQLKGKKENVKDVKSEEITETAEKMAEEIAETFNVTVEEVESILETLGLTVVDLLNVENLTQVVLALNPGCDALSLMTNEELFADLKGLMNTAQELKNQLVQDYNLTEEELETVLDSAKEKTEEIPEASNEGTVIPEASNEGTVIPEASNEGTVIPKVEVSQEVRNGTAETREDSGNAPAQQFTQNFVNQLAEAVENVNDSTTTYGVSGREIINQITEQIRIHVKQDTTEMELHLHPASLGNVKVQLTSAGGVLTAIFTTENETVKAALEAQLIQLKENFTEQGLKVESVEVNVSAQGFERSLDQQEQEKNRFEDNKNRKANRRIRLNGLEDSEEFLTEDMTADDRIVADMMIRNGNTVDYTV